MLKLCVMTYRGGIFYMDYMKKISEYSFLWAVGGCLYYGFEILFRGFSHWTMFVLGGICLMFFGGWYDGRIRSGGRS